MDGTLGHKLYVLRRPASVAICASFYDPPKWILCHLVFCLLHFQVEVATRSDVGSRKSHLNGASTWHAATVMDGALRQT